jgi:hypothetical protein
VRQRTDLEKFHERGETIRLTVHEVRSPLVPKWWEFRRRIRWMRIRYRVDHNRKSLSPETQSALAWAEEALEREFLYGKD